MEEIVLTASIIREAVERVGDLRIFARSHRGHHANVVGSIGEVVFERFLSAHGIVFRDHHRSSTKHDYVVDGGVSIDVKTKDRTVRPKPFFANSVSLYNHSHQRPDYYFFVSLLREPGEFNLRLFRLAYLVGGIDITTLDRDGVRWKSGDVDPKNGIKFCMDCLNIETRSLISCQKMTSILSTKKSLSRAALPNHSDG